MGVKTDGVKHQCVDISARVRRAKAVNPFDLHFEHAMQEYPAGRTTSLRDLLIGQIGEDDGDNE
jgi:hypothetical protein